MTVYRYHENLGLSADENPPMDRYEVENELCSMFCDNPGEKLPLVTRTDRDGKQQSFQPTFTMSLKSVDGEESFITGKLHT